MKNFLLSFVVVCTAVNILSAQDIFMSNGSYSQCTGFLFDSGGQDNNYANNEEYTLTLCPDSTEPGAAVELDFSTFDTQQNADILTIYDGDDTSGALIGSFSGTNSPGVILASNPTGCLTLVFSSSGSISRPGFEALISCAVPCQDIEPSIDSNPPPGLGGLVIIDQGTNIDFTGSAIFSVDGTGATYSWDFGGTGVANGQNVSHTFNTIGTFTVTLTVTDTNPTGCSGSTTLVVQVLGPYLLIDQTTYTNEELVENILINSSCADVSNIVSSTGSDFGSTNGIGYFSGNGFSFPFTQGIVLTTGNAADAGGPESGTLSDGTYDWPGDADLENAIPDLNIGDTNNATFIQFDFTPLANTISFNFVFASEEYGTFQCSYTDAFAFLLTDNATGQTINLALVPGTTDPVSVLSVRNNIHNTSCSSVNEEFFGAYYGTSGLPEIDSPIDFRGHTVSMAAQATVIPNSDYTIKLVIADDSDTLYDAAVFLEAGSFDLGGNLGDDVTIEAGNALCLGGTITLDSQLPGADHIWYFNDEIIENETSSTIEISQAGVYTVDIIFGEECATSDSILIEYKPSPVVEDISDLVLCNAGNPTFDLTENDALIFGSQSTDDFNLTYHTSLEDAENDSSPITTNLTNFSIATDSQQIFIRIEDVITETCYVTASFNLILTEAPPISSVTDLFLCDDISNDNTEIFDLETQTLSILGALSPDNYTVSYYASFEDANTPQNALPLSYNSISDNQPIFVRIDNIDDAACYSVSPDPVFNLVVTNKALATTPSDLALCDSSGTGSLEATFDLDQQTTTILGSQDPSTFAVTYHATPADADTGMSPLASPLTTTSQTIYVRVEEAGLPDCYATTSFNLTVESLPTTVTMTPLSSCDDDTDGFTSFTLTDKDSEALGGQTGVTVSYHPTDQAAAANTSAIGPTYSNTTADTEQIWIRLTNDTTGCYSIMSMDLIVDPLPVAQPAVIASLCDDDTDGLQTFDMSGVASQVIGTQTDMLVSYHATVQAAQDSTGSLGDSITTTTPDVQTIYIRLENALTGCYVISSIDLVVDPLPTIASLEAYVLCDDTSAGDLEETFDLSTMDSVVIGTQTDVVVSYHATEQDAQDNTGVLPTLYNSPTQTIYAALENTITGCRAVEPLDLIVESLPTTVTMTPLSSCDDDTDGFTSFTLTDKDSEALGGQTGVTVSYHPTDQAAAANTSAIGPTYSNTTADTEQIWIRLTNDTTGCYSIMSMDLIVDPLPVAQPAVIASLCDDDTDGLQTFDMSGVASQVIGTQTDMLVSYHATVQAAQDSTGSLGDSITTTTPDVQTIYIRLENALTGCYVISSIDLVVDPLPTIASLEAYVLCDDTSAGDLEETFDLSTMDSVVIGTQTDVVVSYHATEQDAQDNTGVLPTLYNSPTQTIYAALENTITGCRAVEPLDLIVESLPTTVTMTPLSSCDDDTDGFTSFTLTDKDSEALGGQTGVTVSYHPTDQAAAANTSAIGPTYSNTTADTEQIWIRLTNDTTGCYSIMSMDLIVDPLPVAQPAVIASLCDDDTDGLQTFDMSGVASQVIGTQTDMLVSYHATVQAAQDSTGSLGDSITTTTPDVQTIYIRLENALTGCYVISSIDLVVDPLPTIASLEAYVLCDDTSAGDLEETFDLSTMDSVVIGTQTDVVVSYHATEQDAQDNTGVLPTLYNSPTQTIYAALENTITGCRAVEPLDLIVESLPTTVTMTPLSSCDDDTDGFTSFTLTDKDSEALGGQTGVTVSYHPTDQAAAANTSAIGPTYSNTTADTEQIWIRLTNDTTGCYSIMSMDLIVDPLPVAQPAVIASLCDDDTDGLQTFDMSGVASQVIGTQTDMLVSYHATVQAAQDSTGSLGDSITTTTPDVQTIYIRLENALTGCYVISSIDLVVDPLPVVDLDDEYVICSDSLGGGLDYVVVDPGLSPAVYSFTWRDDLGTVLSTAPTYTVTSGGVYSLEVSYVSSTGCTAPLEVFSVSESGSPDVTAEVVTEAFADTHVIIATATGTGIYEFSLDQGPWQDSGTFIGVDPGEHAVNIRDVNGCGTTTVVLYVIDYPNYFTPNGDGYHDTWNISALSGQLGSRIFIFDRYGKLLKQISPAGEGWDGTYNGQPMPTSDYWFLLEYNDFTSGQPKQLRAHFSLKR